MSASEVVLPIGQIDRAYLMAREDRTLRRVYYVGVTDFYPQSPMFVEMIGFSRTNVVGCFEVVPLVPPEQIIPSKHLRPVIVRFPFPPIEPEELGRAELRSGSWQVELQERVTITDLERNVSIKSTSLFLSGRFVTPPLSIDKETEGEWVILAGGDRGKHLWLCFPPLGYWLLMSKQPPPSANAS